MLQLYRHQGKPLDDQILRNPVDSFRTDSQYTRKKQLPFGNYLKVKALKNSLNYELVENHNIKIDVFTNAGDQQFIVMDRNGNAITDAAVKKNDRLLNLDPISKSYHIKTGKKPLVIEVSYQGTDNFFSTDQRTPYRGYVAKTGFFYKLGQWFKDLFDKDDKHQRDEFGDDYTGFVVFNKPMYKPYDTIKFKAYIIDKKHKKPLNVKQLEVDLDDNKIAVANTYRPGGFEYSFVLADSLKLKLDNRYEVSLLLTMDEAKKMNVDEDEREVIKNTFRYEAYELKATKFTMRLAQTEHQPGTPQTVYLKATDENDLPVADGRVDLVFVRRNNNTAGYKPGHIFVPDTLWKQKVKLDPVGETKTPVPDSIFRGVNINYEVYGSFLNSANEHVSDSKYGTFDARNFSIETKVNGDTLKMDYKDRGKSITQSARLLTVAVNDTLANQVIALPAKIIINPYATSYEIATDSANERVQMSTHLPAFTVDATRTVDSIFAIVRNPTSIKFWYTVFEGNRVIDQGEANQLNYHRAYSGSEIITVHINYFWAGTNHETSARAIYPKNLLNIVVRQPITAYPGQSLKTDIIVTDAAGKPVPDVDLTAWGLTSKFPDYYPTQAPSLADAIKNYPTQPSWNTRSVNTSGTINLKWTRWSKAMGLDSIAYYQFTHTKTVYRSEEPARDYVTQIAPFIVKDGKVLPIYILYIDEKPVYFNQAQQINSYSFATAPGLHSLRFRTDSQSIKVDSVYVPLSKKLIIGINAGYGKSIKVSDTLSLYEAHHINAYMISLINNFSTKQVAVSQSTNIFSFHPGIYPGQSALMGPISGNLAFLDQKGEKGVAFVAEGGFSYLFAPGFLKQKSVPDFPFTRQLKSTLTTDSYNLNYLTQANIDTIWQDYFDLRSRTTQLFQNNAAIGQTGRLVINHDLAKGEREPFIKSIIFYRYDNPDFLAVYSGITTDFNQFEKGKYRVMFLLKGDVYDIKENVEIKPFGLNYYRFHITATHPRDSVSIKISNIINNRPSDFYRVPSSQDETAIKEAFNEKYISLDSFSGMVTGTVYGESDGLPNPGVVIRVKGTTQSALTNADGHFKIAVPPRGTLVVASIGYETREINIEPGANIRVDLKEDGRSLQEVVVVGYGTVRRAELTGAISVVSVSDQLAGKIPGVLIEPGANGNIRVMLRGNRTVGNNNKALIVVDGVPQTNGDVSEFDPNDILSFDVLSGASATALYGSRASDGVIVISTKRSLAKVTDAARAAGEQDSGGLRRNFSDYVFWQPKLITDASGRASFTTTIPDDITNWRTFFLGINDKKQSGFKELSIKSFRPVSASFISPLFAVRGDQMGAIGKVMNYTDSAVQVTRTFKYNGKLLKNDVLSVKNAEIDTLNIVADGKDSLSFEYALKRPNGYTDGERRLIPIIERGLTEAKGSFDALRRDTTLTMTFDPQLGPVTFRAEASALPILLETTEHLRQYQYLCNEQLASKLKGLLAEKKIKTYLNEPFKWDKNIREIIDKLQTNKTSAGTWGWWNDSGEEMWISLHVVEALTEAKNMGYATNLNVPKLTDYLIYQLESYSSQDKMDCLELLHLLDAKVDYQKYADTIRKRLMRQKELTTYNDLRLMLLRAETKQKVNTDSLMATQRHTMFGNSYWGEPGYNFFDNSIQNTVLAYKILSADGKHADVLERIRGYFLEQRKDGDWRNTYETSLVLETILPDILKEKNQLAPATITVNGTTVTQFPYSATLSGNTANISKKGTLPVYVTGYQQFFNRNPEKVSKDFTVDTWFEKDQVKISRLTGGQAVQLKVKVTVRADADYVMTEVPIPAGCSYESKEQVWGNNEVHREYFNEKVSIFSRKLKQGEYTFTINLMPRYDGLYNLNPAKAEMMYFPVFYGREGIKKIAIGGK